MAAVGRSAGSAVVSAPGCRAAGAADRLVRVGSGVVEAPSDCEYVVMSEGWEVKYCVAYEMSSGLAMSVEW